MTLGGQKLRNWRYRQEPFVSQTTFGNRCGYSAMTISRFEKGESDPPLKFVLYVQSLGIAEPRDWTQQAARQEPGSEADEASAACG